MRKIEQTRRAHMGLGNSTPPQRAQISEELAVCGQHRSASLVAEAAVPAQTHTKTREYGVRSLALDPPQRAKISEELAVRGQHRSASLAAESGRVHAQTHTKTRECGVRSLALDPPVMRKDLRRTHRTWATQINESCSGKRQSPRANPYENARVWRTLIGISTPVMRKDL